MTQLEALRDHLDKGHTINSVTAFNQLGISCITAVIAQLTRQNYPITRRREPHVTPLDEVVYLMTYWRTIEKGPRDWTPNHTGLSEIPTDH